MCQFLIIIYLLYVFMKLNKYIFYKMECRICLDDNKDELYKNICNCKGSLHYIHKYCLLHWIQNKNDLTCEICKSKYNITFINEINKFDMLYITIFYIIIVYDINYFLYFTIFYFTNLFILGIYISILLNMNVIYIDNNTNIFFILLYYMILLMYYICSDNIVVYKFDKKNKVK